MEYLKASTSLLSFIKETNQKLLGNLSELPQTPNRMFIQSSTKDVKEVVMTAFTNDFVITTLANESNSKAFVMTDIATMLVKGTELTYILYKGYHSDIEKGMVFYQIINRDTLEYINDLQFSNIEENIFYSISAPEQEESSCNAMETDEEVKNGKSIVFLIGHMNENRLLYDIQRLIFDTVNNVRKHSTIQFNFIINIARFGGSPSAELKQAVKNIEAYTKQHIYTEYQNVDFKFEFEQESKL
nr:hypothetical protein [uncultured Carboxylicivirga sp.]